LSSLVLLLRAQAKLFPVLVQRFQELGTPLNLQDLASCWDSNLARYPALTRGLLFRGSELFQGSESFPEFARFPGLLLGLPSVDLPSLALQFQSVQMLPLNLLYQLRLLQPIQHLLRRQLLRHRRLPAFQTA
jgi:hypothetical protein